MTSAVPSVGVVIPTYRGRPWIRDALNSVAHQQFAGTTHIVVVEDGSPAGETVEDMADAFHCRYLRFFDNRGVFTARTAGWKALPPVEYIAFLDQDDWWAPNFLARMIQALEEQPNAPLAACNVRLAGEAGSPVLYARRKPRLTLSDLKVANQLATPSQVLARYRAVREANLEPRLSSPGSDDWLLWLALLRHGDGVYVDEPLAVWRQHPDAFHHRRASLRASEDAVVREWFSRLGFSSADIRRYWGRIALDAIVQRNSWSEWWQGWALGIRDPVAVCAAVRFRYEHRRQGIV